MSPAEQQEGRGVSVTREQRARARRKVRGIHHVGITVADLDRSLSFYRDLLGMRLIGLSVEAVGSIVGMPGASARIADLDAGGGQLLELQGLGGVYSDVFLPLHGEHQAHNAALALAAVEAFFGAGSAEGP